MAAATSKPSESLDSLASLEERITRAVELVTRLRGEKEALEAQLENAIAERDQARAAQAEAASSRGEIQRLTQEVEELRGERRQVRTRIEKLLAQMDLLSGA